MLTVQRGIGDRNISVFGVRESWSEAGLVGTTLLVILGGLLVALSWCEYELNPYYSTEFTNSYNFTQYVVTDRDLKMAFVFYDNQTGQTIKSSQLINSSQSTVYFFDKAADLYYEQSLLICSPDYLLMQNLKPETCVSLPHQIEYSLNYTYKFEDLDTIYFGVAFTSAFKEPFLAAGQDWKNVFEWSYFVCFFTSTVLDEAGHKKLQPHRINSLNYDTQLFLPTRAIGLSVNSWMAVIHQGMFFFDPPRSQSGLEWVGTETSLDLQNIFKLNYEGIGLNLITSTDTIYQYRYYAQVNAIISSIAGILYIAYLLFSTVLSLPSRANNHNHAVKELIASNEAADISCWEILKADLKKESNSHEKSYREMTDLINILKKNKVTLRNIEANLKLAPFEVSKLYFYDKNQQNQPEVSIQGGQEKDQLENIHQVATTTISKDQIDPQANSQDNHSWFSQLDIFGVPAAFTSSEGCSMCRILSVLLVLILTWLFCSGALAQMRTTRYEFSEINKSNMKQIFDMQIDFNVAICLNGVDKNQLTGQSSLVKNYFYLSEDGQQTIIQAIQVPNLILNVPQSFWSSICFKPNISKSMAMGFNGQGEQSYLGFRIDVLETGNSSRSNAQFFGIMTSLQIYILYVSRQFSIADKNFGGQTVIQPVNLNFIIWDQFAYEEQVFLEVIQIQYEDRSIQKRLSFNEYSGILQSRTIQAQQYYDLQLKLGGAHTSYTLHYQYSNYSLLGLLGGLLLFWTFFVGRWVQPYLNLKSNLRIASLLFDPSIIGNSDKTFIKYFWWLPLPLWPIALWKKISKIHAKIKEELDLIRIIKENNKVYQASTELFDTVQKKEIAHCYIKDFSEDHFDETKENLEVVSVESNFNKSNEVMPENKKDNRNVFSSEELIQEAKETIEVDRPVSRVESWGLDLFSYPSGLNLKGVPLTKSNCGAIFSLAFMSMIAALSFNCLASSSSQVKVGMDNYIEDIIDDDSGFTLTVDSNFQFLISFRTQFQDRPENVSDYFANNTVQMVIEKSQIIRNGTFLKENITRTNLVPCFLQDFKQWIGPRLDQSFFEGEHFCIPSGLRLSISNFHDGLQKQSFRLVIKQIKDSTTNNFMMSYLPVLHISTPICDPLSKNISYSLQRFFIDYAFMQGVSHNFSLSKIVFNSKVDTPFSLEAYSVFGDNSLKSSFSLADDSYRLYFSKNARVRSSTACQRSYWPIMGLLGGMWYILYGLAFFIVSSFNRYVQKYLIARDLYQMKKASEPKLLLRWLFSFFKSNVSPQGRTNLIKNVERDLQIETFLKRIRQYNLALRRALKHTFKDKCLTKHFRGYKMLNEDQVKKKAVGYGLQIDKIFAEKKENSQVSICET